MQPLGIFTCKCGFEYTRLGPDKTVEDKFLFRHVRNYGEVWHDSVLNLIDKKHFSFRKAAKYLGVDVGTVIKYYRRPLSCGKRFKSGTTIRRKEYRNRWTKALKENKELNRSEIRNLFPNVYMWLYRNDKDWLNEKSANSSQKKSVIRVDWEKRDLDTLLLLKTLLLKRNLLKKPQRITKRYLGVGIRKLSWIEKKIDKLPLTKLFIESFSESSFEYREKLKEWKGTF